ncbi:MAG TPA: RimK family alpha-L-glutamate ligase [Patescibacteria group bacterium]|nr:RimK family alpha-L-glutamate ligase [Patescibacteria group bacterium]
MKITLITSAASLDEVRRIKEESLALGHEFKLIDFSSFKFFKKGHEFSFSPEIPDSDLVIIRGLFSTMKSLESLKDYLGYRRAKIFDNNLFAQKYSMNKSYDILKLILHKIPVPDTFSTREYKDLYRLGDKLGFPLVMKSSRAGKGGKVWLVKDNSEFVNFINKFDRENYPAKNILVQGFIDYKYDLRILVIGEKMYCMRRIPRAGDFRANFSLGGSVELFPLTPELKKLAKDAMDAIGLEVAGVDVLIDKDNKNYILEVNHTPGMVGMEKATGENITKIYLNYAIKNAR